MQLDPLLLLSFLPRFEKYCDDLKRKGSDRTAQESHVLNTVVVLIDYLRKDYAATLAKVANLTAHGEITFDTLFAIFVPHTTVIADCPVTGEPRAFELVSATKLPTVSGGVYDLICESVDAAFDADPDAESTGGPGPRRGAAAFNPAAPLHSQPIMMPPPVPMGGVPGMDPTLQRAAGKMFGRVQSRIFVPHFKGTVKINSLEVYPIEHHANPGALEMALIERGKKWLALRGVHHMQYKGTATYSLSVGAQKTSIKYNVCAPFQWSVPLL